jgi:hypothetical protein
MCKKVSLLLLAAAIAASTVFTGCNKDDDGDGGGSPVLDGNAISGTVAGIGDKVDEIRLEIEEYVNDKPVSYPSLATAEFKNDGFSLTLPATVTNGLFPITEEFEEDDEATDLTISDYSVRLAYAELKGYRDGVQTGTFGFGNDATYIYIVYSTGDVSITGTEVMDGSYTRLVNCRIKKGWNLMAETDRGENADGIHIAEFTTTIPAGIQCCFDPEENGGGTVPGGIPIGGPVNGAGNAVDEVRLLFYTYLTENTYATMEFKNGGFIFDLPNPVPSQYIGLLSEGMQTGVKISDASAKSCQALLSAYKSGKRVGSFYYQNYNGDNAAAFLYVDRDVTITGTETGSDYITQYNCNLKKGWNLMVAVAKGMDEEKLHLEITTTLPAVQMEWVFDSDSDYSGYSAKAASPRAAGRKALLGRLK